MSDYEQLQEIFEMSELLTRVRDDILELKVIHEPAGAVHTIVFVFDEGQLIEAYTEE